uniref:Uncharacterized protein n=1 Tax=Anguilla anguilla TaxID=7936 RepID=A0A0E9QB71_ANGAN
MHGKYFQRNIFPVFHFLMVREIVISINILSV